MLKVSIKINGLKEAVSSLIALKDQAPMIMAKTLTKVAKATKEKQVAKMKEVFDRPNKYVLNSLFVTMATPQNLKSSVWLREFGGVPAESFLGPQIFGGRRSLKRFEKALQIRGVLPRGMYAVPGSGADLDSYGNMKPSQIIKIISYFGAFGEQGYKANMTVKKIARLKKGTKKTAGYVYFALQKRAGKLPPGIYERTGTYWGAPIKCLLLFINSPTYNKRFPFHEIGEKVMESKWKQIFNDELQYTLDKMK